MQAVQKFQWMLMVQALMMQSLLEKNKVKKFEKYFPCPMIGFKHLLYRLTMAWIGLESPSPCWSTVVLVSLGRPCHYGVKMEKDEKIPAYSKVNWRVQPLFTMLNKRGCINIMSVCDGCREEVSVGKE